MKVTVNGFGCFSLLRKSSFLLLLFGIACCLFLITRQYVPRVIDGLVLQEEWKKTFPWNLKNQNRNLWTYPGCAPCTRYINQNRSYEVKDNLTNGSLDRADQSKKVLLLAYFRSGSTFTGQAIAHLNRSFFVFEPLHVMQNYLLKTRTRLTYLNGTTRPALMDGYEATYRTRLLVSLLTCEFEGVDTATLFLPFLPKFSHQISTFVDCAKNYSSDHVADCLFALKQSCLSASVRVIKTIRLSMQAVEAILDLVPDLKVIHLIRDPRGQLRSAILRLPYENPTLYRERVCNMVSNDIKTRQHLEQKYHNTFREVIYEDLAQHPVESLRRLYEFLGLILPDYVSLWIQQSTSSSSENNDYLGTVRSNSTLTAYTWVHSLNWADIYYFQGRCSWLLQHGNFPVFKSQHDINTFRVPRRDLVW